MDLTHGPAPRIGMSIWEAQWLSQVISSIILGTSVTLFLADVKADIKIARGRLDLYFLGPRLFGRPKSLHYFCLAEVLSSYTVTTHLHSIHDQLLASILTAMDIFLPNPPTDIRHCVEPRSLHRLQTKSTPLLNNKRLQNSSIFSSESIPENM